MENPHTLVTWAKESEMIFSRVPEEKEPNNPKQCRFGLQWTYAFATAFPKLSVLFFYRRLFPTKLFRITVYVLMFMVVGLCASIVIVSLFQCSPIAYAWDRTIKGGTCIDELAYFRWITPPNLIIDLALLILPLPMVWRLHTSVGQKAGLTLTFVTGSMSVHMMSLSGDNH